VIDVVQYLASAIIHGIGVMLWQRGMPVAAIALTLAGFVFLFNT